MRIEVVDPSGLGLGLAIGLVELGHEVRYRPAASKKLPGEVGKMVDWLVARHFGRVERLGITLGEASDCDLLVIVDAFADHLDCLEQRRWAGETTEVTDPWQDNAGALVYPHRLQCYLERIQIADRVAVVDMSDRRGPREFVFEQMPNAVLFAREVASDEHGAWLPLPFLYNHVMLWLEHCRPRGEWWQPTEQRVRRWDWLFCGTVDHPRYGDLRRRALATMGELWPDAAGMTVSRESFVNVLAMMPSSRCCLDLPGEGELCFRRHESLAVGTPLWQPTPASLALPKGLQQVVVQRPQDLPDATPDEVRAIYLEHYAPRAAATTLLAGVAATAPSAL